MISPESTVEIAHRLNVDEQITELESVVIRAISTSANIRLFITTPNMLAGASSTSKEPITLESRLNTLITRMCELNNTLERISMGLGCDAKLSKSSLDPLNTH